MSADLEKKFIFIVKLCCFLIFFGRGWQHFFWDAPFRTVLWNQGLLSPIIESLTSYTWQDYATSERVNSIIDFITKIIGVFYFVMSFFCIIVNEKFRKSGKLLLLGFISLLLLSFLYYMEKFFYIGMLIEHAIQFGMPLVLYLCLFKENFFSRYLNLFKVMIALTFIGHGLFAFGYHPVPGPFIDMIINILKVSESEALYMLKVAGTFDFVAGIFLFVPGAAIYALMFNVFWGVATAFARILAHVDLELMEFTSHQWIFETVYRIPHGLFPLGVLIILLKLRKTTSSSL